MKKKIFAILMTAVMVLGSSAAVFAGDAADTKTNAETTAANADSGVSQASANGAASASEEAATEAVVEEKGAVEGIAGNYINTIKDSGKEEGILAVKEIDPETLLVINWEDISAEIEGSESWEGEFAVFKKAGIKMYIPAIFKELKINDTDRKEGYLAYYTLGDKKGIGVLCADLGGMSISEYKEILEQQMNVTNIEAALVNGIIMLSYISPENKDLAVAAFQTASGYIMEVTFTPAADEDFASIASIIMSSIQEYEVEITEEITEAVEVENVGVEASAE